MEKYQDLIEKIEKMSVLELAELVKALEEKFGVSAQAMAVAAPAAVGAGAEGGGAQEKTNFSVVLTNAGDQKIQVIKAIREITGLGLKEAKDIADAAPKPIKDNVPKAEADEVKKKLEEVGATVELK